MNGNTKRVNYIPDKNAKKRGSLLWGLVLVFLGLIWLLSVLKIIPWNWQIIYASLFIIVGIYLIVRWIDT
ncbi:MAG: hypothetical protein M1481_06160 [Candidatus Thermoplasmatota archaeon]|jgi:hypothetical protein|nr:hypothetical protein [Candidatus Thermoplasmatota archaeon]MCL5964069.1 hypothetical protein [Candidatus Thermoplasmatota archaeon]